MPQPKQANGNKSSSQRSQQRLSAQSAPQINTDANVWSAARCRGGWAGRRSRVQRTAGPWSKARVPPRAAERDGELFDMTVSVASALRGESFPIVLQSAAGQPGALPLFQSRCPTQAMAARSRRPAIDLADVPKCADDAPRRAGKACPGVAWRSRAAAVLPALRSKLTQVDWKGLTPVNASVPGGLHPQKGRKSARAGVEKSMHYSVLRNRSNTSSCILLWIARHSGGSDRQTLETLET